MAENDEQTEHTSSPIHPFLDPDIFTEEPLRFTDKPSQRQRILGRNKD